MCKNPEQAFFSVHPHESSTKMCEESCSSMGSPQRYLNSYTNMRCRDPNPWDFEWCSLHKHRVWLIQRSVEQSESMFSHSHLHDSGFMTCIILCMSQYNVLSSFWKLFAKPFNFYLGPRPGLTSYRSSILLLVPPCCHPLNLCQVPGGSGQGGTRNLKTTQGWFFFIRSQQPTPPLNKH